MWSEYTYNEKMKITSSSGMYKILHDNGSYLLILERNNDNV